MTNVYQLPTGHERNWNYVAKVLHDGTLQRTGSEEIAAAVVARCKDAFLTIAPESIHLTADSLNGLTAQFGEHLNVIVGKFMAELGLLAEELELEKRRGGA